MNIPEQDIKAATKNYYMHVDSMTRDGLARELAYRDLCIDALSRVADAARKLNQWHWYPGMFNTDEVEGDIPEMILNLRELSSVVDALDGG